jgi:terminase small subunit-like protein
LLPCAYPIAIPLAYNGPKPKNTAQSFSGRYLFPNQVLPQGVLAKLSASHHRPHPVIKCCVSEAIATQAAIRAGYSAKTAQEQGSQLLAKLKRAMSDEGQGLRSCFSAIAEQFPLIILVTLASSARRIHLVASVSR